MIEAIELSIFASLVVTVIFLVLVPLVSEFWRYK